MARWEFRRIGWGGWLLCSSLMFGACTADDKADNSSLDGGPADALPSDARVAADSGTDGGASGGCSADTVSACDYMSHTQAAFGRRVTQSVTYTDVGGLPRTIELELRLPMGAADGPVVVWSHGGASGQSDAASVGVEWGEVFVRAGYVTVAIAHAPRTRVEYDGLCAGLDWGDACGGQDCAQMADCAIDGEPGICVDGGCRFWKHLSWDRPHDLSATLDWLSTEATPGGRLDGIIDLDRLVYAGHSAGAGSTMMVAGATRLIAGADTLLTDPRPVAFISASPQGPGDDGFTEGSFTGDVCQTLAADPAGCLARPHLILTGVGDDTDVVAENRRLAFDLAPEGDRHLAWITEEAARHTTFNYGVDACERHQAGEGADPARCEAYRLWLRAVVLAFLDAHLRGDADAAAYLASDNPAVFSGGALSWEHR